MIRIVYYSTRWNGNGTTRIRVPPPGVVISDFLPVAHVTYRNVNEAYGAADEMYDEENKIATDDEKSSYPDRTRKRYVVPCPHQ